MNSNKLLLPPASRLVHIGPHKTGTTSLQRAFHANRSKLDKHGVHLAGQPMQPLLSALAVAGGDGMRGDRPARPEDWTELVDEVRDAGDQRVVVSSEFLCHADDEAARRVVTETPGGPVHVVITLRHVAKIAPSQYQQYVQNGLRVPYAKWLDGTFRRPPYEKPTPSFWRRHRHGPLVRRWAEAVGVDNLTVVVADDSDPDMLLRTFEAFLGLPEELLVAPKNAGNRSLALGETELVRLLNTEFAERKWSDDAHVQFVRHGAARKMKVGRRPAADEQRLSMPRWALESAAEAGAETVETIKSLGVRVIGDLATLSEVPEDRLGDEAELSKTPLLPADAATCAVLGAINASGRRGTGADLAAALAVLGAMTVSAERGEPDEAPLIPADAAARAVLGVIEASGEEGVVAELAGQPRIAGSTAALAVLGAVNTTGGYDFTAARPVLRALEATGQIEARKAAPKQPGQGARKKSVDKRLVRDVKARDLLRVVARRGRRRLRRR